MTPCQEVAEAICRLVPESRCQSLHGIARTLPVRGRSASVYPTHVIDGRWFGCCAFLHGPQGIERHLEGLTAFMAIQIVAAWLSSLD